ncbi:MAG: phosphatase PAP2 family protein [Thermomicrobiales bacterium]
MSTTAPSPTPHEPEGSPSRSRRVVALLRKVPAASWSARAWAIAAALAVVLLVVSLFSNRGFLGWGLVVLVGVMIFPRSHAKSFVAAVIPYAALWFIFTLLRSFADETLWARKVNLKVSELERWLFGGELPSIRLQDALYTPGHIHVWDYYFVFIHWSYFLVPHAVALWLWWRHPDRFWRFLLALTILLSLGLGLYFGIPSNPPWMAPESVNTPSAPVVLRIMEPIAKQLGGGLYQAGYKTVGESNPIAAMPSIHFAVTFLLFWPMRLQGKRWALIFFVYAMSMGFGLVYLGEHYVVDVTMGGIIATIGWFAAGAILRRVDARRHASSRNPEAAKVVPEPEPGKPAPARALPT